MKLDDLTNQRFSKLTVLHRTDPKSGANSQKVWYLCLCDCGNRMVALGKKLKSGRTKSCGCLNGDNLKKRIAEIVPGKVFNSLTVIRKIEGNPPQYLCECAECGGGEAVIKRSQLLLGKKSCGCLTRVRDSGESGMVRASIISKYRSNARKRGYVWELTNDHATSLFKSNCHYCGLPPSQTMSKKGQSYTYNGIDRTDNSLGYVEGNVVACCKTCNFAKGEMSLEEFRGWVLRIYNFGNLVPVPQMVP